MKKINVQLSTLALALLAMVSCEKEEHLKRNNKESDTQNLKTIIVNGEPIYAGYGYDPGEDRAYRNAIDPHDVYESTDIQPALSVQVGSVKSLHEVEEHSKSTYTVTTKKNKFLGLFKHTHSTTRTIETYVKINEQSISIIAKIKVHLKRFHMNAEPSLLPEAQKLLDEKQYDEFLGNYGPYFVSSRTIGGEVQYVYNYSYCNIELWTKSAFIDIAKSNILGIFGQSTSINVTEEDKRHIEEALVSAHILSGVPGYAPKMVKTIDDASEEMNNLLDYLNKNLHKATTMEMELTPYSELVEDEILQQKTAEKQKCLKQLEDYELYYDRLHYVYKNSPAKSKQAYREMQDTRDKINNLSCSGSHQDLGAIFEQNYGNISYDEPCGNYTCDFKVLMLVGDEGLGNNGGAIVSTPLNNTWSHWAGDDNLYDPDWVQVCLALDSYKPTRMVDTDYRLAIQVADDHGTSQFGTVCYTHWASSGGGWSPWASDANVNKFDVIRIMLQTRPRKNFIVDDLRIGIQSYDHDRNPHLSPRVFTPWVSEGGGWSGYAGYNSFKNLDEVRICLYTR